MDRVELTQMLEEGLSLAEIGARVGRDPSTVSYWVKKHRLALDRSAKFAPKGALAFDDLAPLVQAGLSVAAIARRLARSPSTVRYWLRRHDLRIRRGERARLASEARASGERSIRLKCARHGLTRHVRFGKGGYRCSRCNSEAVSEARRRAKRILVSEAGGCCVLCGYNRSMAALQFHHLDPDKKRFQLSLRGLARSLDKAREEARKCALLCANCHAEVEVGAAIIGPAPKGAP